MAAIHESATGEIQVCLADLLAGEVWTGSTREASEIQNVFLRWRPKEVLIHAKLEKKNWYTHLLSLFPSVAVSKRDHYFDSDDPNCAWAALKRYVAETQGEGVVSYWQPPKRLFSEEAMLLDGVTLSALELIEGAAEDSPTLFGVINKTRTAMGRRFLKASLIRPLTQRRQIETRLSSVENLLSEPALLDSIRQQLGEIRDLERLATKTALGLALPRDLVAIREILRSVRALKSILLHQASQELKDIGSSLDSLDLLMESLNAALLDSPASGFRDGNIFRDTYSEEVRTYRELSTNAKSTIAAMENRERERTGISVLKIKYSRVFGYTIEVTKSHLHKVPPEYVRKQTIANGERFVTEELKDFEQKAMTAEYKLKAIEESLFLELRRQVAAHTEALLADARILALLDMLQSFATVSKERNYVRPKFHAAWDLRIDDGRHPVVEALLSPGAFVPNSIEFTENECRTLLMTGPNMAGKSTIMRQVALISLMAQTGCFVPARSAVLPLVDAIYTRIGSSDDLAHGRSTFMVEMTEMARILNHATPRSLILIDEIGRGTSTYDGLSLAWALLEHLHADVRAKTLFATHFFELTSLENVLSGLQNVNVLVQKSEGQIIFLHRLAKGVCNRSYGVEVAKLAGLPTGVLDRAQHIVQTLETQSQRASKSRNQSLHLYENQMEFFH